MKHWVLTSVVVVALVGVLTGFTAAAQPSAHSSPNYRTSHLTQPSARYRISHLAELSQFQDVRVVALDSHGDLLTNVMRLITIHGNLYNDAHAVLDIDPGTKHAKVIALHPLHGTLNSYAIGMNGSGSVLVEAGTNRFVPFVGTLRDGRMHWNRLYYLPTYGSGSVTGIADNGDIAGEIHGLIRYPHCCKSLQQAVIWRPSSSGSYHSPTFLAPAESTATAIWSAGQIGRSVITGIVLNRLAVWTVLSRDAFCEPHGCPLLRPVIGKKIGDIYSGNEAITSMTGGDGNTLWRRRASDVLLWQPVRHRPVDAVRDGPRRASRSGYVS